MYVKRYWILSVMHNFDIDWLQKTVTGNVIESRYSDAISLIKSFVERIINDDESVGVVFAGRELDALCEMLANTYYSKMPSAPVADGCGTVVLASELVKAGGHVELIKDYIALGLFESPVRIALTDLFNRVDRALIDEWESQFGCEVFIASEAEFDAKLDELTAKFREWNPSTLLTLGHNQDVVCIVLAHAPGIKNRYYIHHGDHHLSLGVTCSAFQHVDLHNMSYHLCKTELKVTRQLYWPISAVRPSNIKTTFLDRGVLTTGSCGRMSKFESGSYKIRYERAIACILKATNGFHVHVGDLSDVFLQRIYEELEAEHIDRTRFIHIEWVASLPQALIENGVDVYVSSFPLGGAKSLIEAMSTGVAVVMHQSYRSRYHSSTDLAYPESFIWSLYEQLGPIFEQWSEPLLRQHAHYARRHFDRYFSSNAFMDAFASGTDCDNQVPPLRAYHGDSWKRYLEFRGRREKDFELFELERDRIFQEWKKVYAAYEEHTKTIARQQALIEKLSR